MQRPRIGGMFGELGEGPCGQSIQFTEESERKLQK